MPKLNNSYLRMPDFCIQDDTETCSNRIDSKLITSQY